MKLQELLSAIAEDTPLFICDSTDTYYSGFNNKLLTSKLPNKEVSMISLRCNKILIFVY